MPLMIYAMENNQIGKKRAAIKYSFLFLETYTIFKNLDFFLVKDTVVAYLVNDGIF